MIGRAAARLRRGRPKPRPTLSRPPYAGRHEGEVALVLGNGPSLSSHRDRLLALIEAERPLTLGANHITPFIHPDYHAFTNRKRFATYGHTIDTARSRVLLSPYFTDELIEVYHGGPYEEIAYVADNDARFDVADGVILAGCRTVSVLLIGVAAVMGARQILVAGLDGFRTVVEGSAGEVTSDLLYHAETAVQVDGPEKHLEVDRMTRRFLREIDAHLASTGREPVAILTPTTYEEHHRPELLP